MNKELLKYFVFSGNIAAKCCSGISKEKEAKKQEIERVCFFWHNGKHEKQASKSVIIVVHSCFPVND